MSGDVRRAEIEEAAEVAGVLRSAFAEYEALYTARAYAATTPTAQEIRARWDEGPVWVCTSADGIVGTVGAVVTGQGVYIRSMGVRPSAGGHGVGRRLLEAVEAFARGRRCGRLYLSTTPFLGRAIRLYERFGFVRSDEGARDLHGTPLFTMAKGL